MSGVRWGGRVGPVRASTDTGTIAWLVFLGVLACPFGSLLLLAMRRWG
jgi:hypothetical protein